MPHNSGRFAHLTSFVLETPWAITPRMLDTIAAVYARHLTGVDADPAGLDDASATARARQDQTDDAQSRTNPAVAVLPIHGVIAPRANMMTNYSGGVTSDAIVNALAAATADPRVRAIVLDLDTPGGSVAGAAVAAQAIRTARTKVPVVAQVQYRACSAGYWLASNATEIVAAPDSFVGSIGVLLIHDNLSKALADMGVERTYITAGEFKADPNETTPLSTSARDRLQRVVDQSMAHFVRDVALGRGVPEERVRDSFGKGDIVSADDAIAKGMIDRVGTMSDTLARFVSAPAGAPVVARATLDTPQEPSSATGQDRELVAWRRQMEREFLEHAIGVQ